MNNDIWVEEVKSLLQNDIGNSGIQCVAEWESLLTRVESGAKESVSDYHIEQTIGFLSHNLHEAGQIEAASATEERLGDLAESKIRYEHVVAGCALARAALIRFELGEGHKAASIAERALGHLGASADPSPFFETLISRLREYRMAEQAGSSNGG